jgi:hypothetical protein
VFIKEMQDTTNDKEIVETLKNQAMADTEFFGVSFFADNEVADKLTKGLATLEVIFLNKCFSGIE